MSPAPNWPCDTTEIWGRASPPDPARTWCGRDRGEGSTDRKPLAHELRALQAVSPGQVYRLGDADANVGDDVDLPDARMQRERRLIQRQLAMLEDDAERLAQF